MMAREAGLKAAARSKHRRVLAKNYFLTCTDVKMGAPALPYKAVSRESAPRWRGLASTLKIDEPGVTVKFQSQTFKTARFCELKKGGGEGYGRGGLERGLGLDGHLGQSFDGRYGGGEGSMRRYLWRRMMGNVRPEPRYRREVPT